jgi:two-component system phosphate regulon sensor histidine kinase PhoR
VLALASIEEDRRLGRLEPGVSCVLAEACEEAKASLEGSLEKHAGSLSWELPPDLPMLACERAAARQVLVNLIENALKYAGPHPSVRIVAREDAASVEVSVLDEGPGIPDADLSRIFERFYRVDKARTRGSVGGGSGLGLAIVKHLVENYGGQVGVENLTQRGCRFWFRIPRLQAS